MKMKMKIHSEMPEREIIADNRSRIVLAIHPGFDSRVEPFGRAARAKDRASSVEGCCLAKTRRFAVVTSLIRVLIRSPSVSFSGIFRAIQRYECVCVCVCVSM